MVSAVLPLETKQRKLPLKRGQPRGTMNERSCGFVHQLQYVSKVVFCERSDVRHVSKVPGFVRRERGTGVAVRGARERARDGDGSWRVIE